MLTPRQLEIFSSVFEEGSMTGAARKIHMSQPAVSQTIREIEDQYGTELFERYGSKLYVTEAGRILYHYSRRIMNLYRDLDEAIQLNDGVREIRVGANISAGTAQLIGLIQKFNQSYPNIAVKTMVFQAPVLLKALQQNELDIALVEDQKKTGGFGDFVMEPYYKDRIMVACSTDHPFAGQSVKIRALENETFLFREKGAGVRDMFDNILSLKGMQVNVGWECTSTDAIVEAVKLNMGIAVLPYLLVKKYLDAGEISEITISDVWLSRNLNITYHKDKVLTKPLRDFIDLVRELKVQDKNSVVSSDFPGDPD